MKRPCHRSATQTRLRVVPTLVAVRRLSIYRGYALWWLLALVPAAVVVVYALLGWWWHPLLVGQQRAWCTFHPAGLVRGFAWIAGLAATLGGAWHALRRRPRKPGVVVACMGLALVGAALLLEFVAVVNDLDIGHCKRD